MRTIMPVHRRSTESAPEIVAISPSSKRNRRGLAATIAKLTNTTRAGWLRRDGESREDHLERVAGQLVAVAGPGDYAIEPDLAAEAEQYLATVSPDALRRHAADGPLVDTTRGGRLESSAAELLASRDVDLTAEIPTARELETMSRWSPFRDSAHRYVCRSGRRGDGSPAREKHVWGRH